MPSATVHETLQIPRLQAEFQRVGTATKNARQPYVLSRKRDTEMMSNDDCWNIPTLKNIYQRLSNDIKKSTGRDCQTQCSYTVS